MSGTFANIGGKLVDVRVFPIALRADCEVRIFGMPHDMSRAEAEKIGRVILALASGMETRQGGDSEAAPSRSDDSPTAKGGDAHPDPL